MKMPTPSPPAPFATSYVPDGNRSLSITNRYRPGPVSGTAMVRSVKIPRSRRILTQDSGRYALCVRPFKGHMTGALLKWSNPKVERLVDLLVF